MSEGHLREVERWKAKQDAFDHLNRLALFLRIRSRDADDAPAWEEVRTAAALAVELALDGPERRSILTTLSRD